ncbi:hypothetical protein DFH11DRAFT_1541265 [Phellopilus nigrolimitatus]|nr:hypothetical protein DFH11DRAFT_1541265 [Phellopilus nigrolimitatus]
MSSRSQANRKPSGGRPNIRRLFSKDSVTSLASKANESITGHAREPSGGLAGRGDEPRNGILKQQTSLITLNERQDEVAEPKPWIKKDFVSSPSPSNQEYDAFEESPTGSGSSTPPSVKVKVPKPSLSSFSKTSSAKQSRMSLDIGPSRSLTSSPPLVSPSKARWDQLRHHVLPSTSSTLSPTPSYTSFSQMNIPAQAAPPSSPAPRPSRLAARFGFRQVVSEAREAADDLTRKFADDIQRACWAARFGDSRPPKPEREPTQATLGSTLHLPFMSSASLPLSSNISASSLAGTSSSKQGQRGAAFSTNSLPQPTSRVNVLLSLQAVVVQYCSVSIQRETAYKYLPHEKEVLSVLLIAFLSQSTGRIAEDERRVSIEIFETIVQSWKTPQAKGELERYLWCCKAATMPSSPLRSRVLFVLSSILTTNDSLLTTSTALRALLPGLAMLVSCYSETCAQPPGSYDNNANDLNFVKDLITKIMTGSYGQLDLEDLEQMYDMLALKTDLEDDLRQGVCVEAIVRCLDYGIPSQKRVILRLVDKNWPLPGQLLSPSPLRSKVHSNKITAFLRSILTILQDPLTVTAPSSFSLSDLKIITEIVLTRILPELEHLGGTEDSLRNARNLVVKVTLALISAEADLDADADNTFSEPKHSQATELVLGWLGSTSRIWKECVHKELKDFATSTEWRTVIHVAYNLLALLPDGNRKNVAGLMIPQFQERMISDPPPYSSEPLSRLLTSLAAVYPQIFYKPLFVCAASTKEETVAHQLAILVALAHYMPNFWTTDAEMVSVALMSDPAVGGGFAKGKAKEGQSPAWGKSRLGQTVVFLELIGKLRSIRVDHYAKQDAGMATNVSVTKAIKFAGVLETRLSILLDAKEQTVFLPLSQRILFSALFLEIRLLTRTLKSITWLPRIISWTTQHDVEPTSNSSSLPTITEDLMDEIRDLWDNVREVYILSKTCLRPPSQDTLESLIVLRSKLLDSLPENPLCTILELLVAICGALTHESLVRLGPIVWERCLNLDDTQAVIHACFICMQCAEKAPDKFMDLLQARMQSPIAAIRKETVQRLSILSGWRFQLLSLTYVTDRTHRRPFKLARPPLSFVATDVGESKYVPSEEEEASSGQVHSLPLDLRRRLSEIGWDDDDKPTDQRLEWLRMPMSLLASSQLDQISTSASAVDDGKLSDRSPSPVTSPGSTPSKSPGMEENLHRRSSSSGGQHGMKRRPVFVEPLLTIFLPLAKLVMDSDFAVASLARDVVMDFMRDDPAILCRPVFDILSGQVEAIDKAITVLRSFLHLRKVLPPRLTHHVFNHLAGFLKFLAKESNAPDSLRDLAYTVPVLAKFSPQVSEMSVQAIRRAKIEVFLFPSGMLYFPETTPSGPMFPKGPDVVTNPFDDCPTTLVHMTMIRTSQNLLFVDMLKRSPQNVHIVRKNWTPLVLPDIMGAVDDDDVVPRRLARRSIPDHSKTRFRISLSFSRSHLLYVAQMFRCLTRHLNDRVELSNFLDGVNRILLRHGDDIGIVSHALIGEGISVYMIASTRFRRLMSSGSGFTLFLPALIKIYCEANGDAGVREAIEYAVHRFFAVHEEVFVYQALQVISSFVAQLSTDGDWIASNAYHLLATLKSIPPDQDAAGIRDANKAQEEETALAITADERPQMFLASLRKDGKTGAEKLQSSLSVEIFDSKRFQPDNIIRMLLTVIAHNPTVRRAEYFLRLFRFLVPHLYNASSSARGVLRDGIDALGAIITTKVTGKTKVPESSQIKPKLMDDDENEDSSANAHTSNKFFGKLSSPCDIQVMRSDYLLLFASYVKAGGAHRVSSLQRSLDLAKIILKDSSALDSALEAVRLFVDQLGETFVLRQDPKYAISLLKELAPIISAHGSVLDLSGLLRSLVTLTSNPNFANDPQFSNIVVTHICSSALEICELAAQENILFTLKFRSTLIELLGRSVCLLGSDIIAELEKRDSSPAFLSGIVIPFIFQLRTTTELATDTQWTDSWRQDAHARAWVRLLSFSMDAFQNQTGAGPKGRRGSIRHSSSFPGPGADVTTEADTDSSRLSIRKPKRRHSGQGNIVVAMRSAMAFVTLKAVILRGQEDISTVFPSAWSRVGALLRSMLRDGGAMFALRTQLSSAPGSPLPSPIASTSFTELIDRTNERPKHRRSSSSTSEARLSAPYPNQGERSSRPDSPSNMPIRRNSSQPDPCPRFVDYLSWSLMEFICRQRCPLVIQLRTFMYEKTIHLHDALQMSDPVTSNASFAGSTRTRRSLRPVSTVYSKPRFGTSSIALTPEGSPRLGPSDPNISFAGNLSTLPSLSGLGNSELGNASTPAGSKGRKPILHLGANTSSANSFLSPSFIPVSNSMNSNLSHSSSAEDVGQADIALDARQALVATTLRAPGLVYRTYQRVRVVQTFQGYQTLLPVPKSLNKHSFATHNADNHARANGLAACPPGDVSASASPRTSTFLDVDTEPEVNTKAWTKRRAAELLLAEAQDLLDAWQTETAITASGSDAGNGDGLGTLSAAVSADDFDVTFVSHSEAIP